jgi:transcriptional regulator with XRE-family HTH domain
METEAPTPDPSSESAQRLQTLRQSLGFSQRELARRAGLTHTTVAAIEKGRIDPSLGTLKRLLEACGVSMSEFFRNENNASIVTEAHRINTVSTGGVHMRYLAPSAPGKLLQITQEIYDAGADTGTKPLRHEGQEGGIVIRGVFELQLGDERYTLRPGDSYYFDSTTPHRLRNIGEEQGEIINAASPPSF